MNNVKDILRSKGREAYWIAPESTVYEALKLMAERNVGALIVLENARIIGIISERDYARKVILQGNTSRALCVSDIMDVNVTCVEPAYTVEGCMALMTKLRTRYLPVIDEGRLVGVISIGDVVKARMAEQAFVIEQLENYITGHARVEV